MEKTINLKLGEKVISLIPVWSLITEWQLVAKYMQLNPETTLNPKHSVQINIDTKCTTLEQ